MYPNRFVLGWPENKYGRDDARATLAPVGNIMTERFSGDVHHVAYAADVLRRHTVALFKKSEHADKIDAANLHMVLAVFDCDHPEHSLPDFVAPDAWWGEQKTRIAALLAAHPGGFVARTRGGFRIVYALPERYGASSSWSQGGFG